MDRADIVIVGGGLAGAAAAEAYRKAGGSGRVVLVSEETTLPIHRPPLSKGYLRGVETLDSVFVHPAGFYTDHSISMRLGARVTRVDLFSKRVGLADGLEIGFGKLVLATGSRARRLPVQGENLKGVYSLRSLADADALRAELRPGRCAVIIGAGFVGMEVAASLTQAGLECTVVEMAPRMWARIVPEVPAQAIQHAYKRRGVSFRFGAGVAALHGDQHVRSVRLDDGTTLEADLVLAGVGVHLNTEIARDAGLDVDGGVRVDDYLTTSQSDVYAVGDIARFPDPVGGSIHLEHWDNALAQGRVVGATLAGRPSRFEHLAYFFSDMFDLSLNMVGYPTDWDDIVVRGNPEAESFTTLYLRNGALRAALMVNDEQNFSVWESLIESCRSLAGNTATLANPELDPGALAPVELPSPA
ncbi:MAG TPA: FAD-dependent oxidoreductase [Chloroflexota bacterium]